MLRYSENEVQLLHAIQYNLRIVEDPYIDLSSYIDMDVQELLERLRGYRDKGVINRVGFTFNYRSEGMVSALVALNIDETLIDEYANFIHLISSITHNYVRDHKRYNVWFTIKGYSDDDIINRVREIASSFNVSDYIILKSVRTCKLSVKYDLRRGVSWSQANPLCREPARLEEFGVDSGIVGLLRNIPIRERPFKNIAGRLGFYEGEFIDLLREMWSKGVITDFGASLNSEKIGFKYNAMIVFKGDEGLCIKVAENVHEASHVVLRETLYGDWMWNIYFMIHGAEYKLVEDRVSEIMDRLGIDEYLKLYSLRNLKRRIV